MPNKIFCTKIVKQLCLTVQIGPKRYQRGKNMKKIKFYIDAPLYIYLIVLDYGLIIPGKNWRSHAQLLLPDFRVTVIKCNARQV